MSKASWRSYLAASAAALLFALPARAEPVIAFEGLDPFVYMGGESFVTEGFEFLFDLVGIGAIDSAAGFAFGNAPTNSSGQFVSMLNAAGITMESETNLPFTLASFAFSFISPFGSAYAPGQVAGQLMMIGQAPNGTLFNQSVDLPAADVDGNFAFATLTTAELAAGFSQPISAIYFLSCIYDASGGCQSGDNAAQFALDNIAIASPSAVPEPGTLLLVALGLGLIGVARRRGLR